MKIKRRNYWKLILSGSIFFFVVEGCINKKTSDKVPDLSTLTIRYKPLNGIGPEKGMLRRDPSDIIQVGGVYYIWYTKVLEGAYRYPEGFQGTVWYATSTDGINWTEKDQALKPGENGKFDDFGVYTPNVLYSPENRKYYLYYTGVARNPDDSTKFVIGGRIGVAEADSPDGGADGWKRCNNGNPVRRTQEQEKRGKFGYSLVDDASLMIWNGKYFLYHKGHPSEEEIVQLNLPKGTTPMGLSTGTKPDGVFMPLPLNESQGFLVQAGHEVLLWKHGNGLAVLPSGHFRPKTNHDFTVHYSEDGINFHPVGGEVPGVRLEAGGASTNGLRAPGLFRPELTDPNADFVLPQWGVCMTGYGKEAGLQRFIFEYEN